MRAVTGLVAAGSIALLLARGAVLGLPARTPLLMAIFVSIGIACAMTPVDHEPGPAPAHRLPVLVAGISSFALVAAVTGSVVALALTPFGVLANSLAAAAEELLFRRALYGWLGRYGMPAAIVGSALAFALVHVPLYGMAALPVDLGAGLVLSWQRWASGTWTVPAATHVAANLVAMMR